MKILPAKCIQGVVRLPGDKSISHRAAMLAAMGDGETLIENYSSSADCGSTLSCLGELGVEIERDGSSVIVKGVGKTGFSRPASPLDCGNSGTTMRLLSGILAGQDFESELTGDDSLRGRPMKRIIGPLRQMGARIEARDYRPPLQISGKYPLIATDHRPEIASAQIKSCILLAGLIADGETSVLETAATRDHTERMLAWLGCGMRIVETGEGKRISVSGDSRITAGRLQIPADISSAAFFVVAAACLPGSRITVPNVGLNPTRTAVLDVLKKLGAQIDISEQRKICNEPVGDLTIGGSDLSAKTAGPNILNGDIISNLIDEIPILAVLGTQLAGGLEVRDAAELRVKESDRITAIVENLRRMNAAVEEFQDGFRVSRSHLEGADVDSFGDHRIAMACAVAGLFANGETRIASADCASVSFPDFFEVLNGAVN